MLPVLPNAIAFEAEGALDISPNEKKKGGGAVNRNKNVNEKNYLLNVV